MELFAGGDEKSRDNQILEAIIELITSEEVKVGENFDRIIVICTTKCYGARLMITRHPYHDWQRFQNRKMYLKWRISESLCVEKI